jgi:hypothetical protein
MYRLLENIRPDRKRAGTRQEPAAKEAADQQGSLKKARWRNHRPNLLGGQ